MAARLPVEFVRDHWFTSRRLRPWRTWINDTGRSSGGGARCCIHEKRTEAKEYKVRQELSQNYDLGECVGS